MSRPAHQLGALSAIVEAAGVAPAIEAVMPRGGRPRQLRVATLLIGIAAAIADDRPAHLRRVHQELVSLPEADQLRLGVMVDGRGGRHVLTYRQVERTFSTMITAIGPNGLAEICDDLIEASIPEERKAATSAVAVDWTDHASWARPAGAGGRAADPDASWGHRNTNTPGTKDGLFFGYYAQAVTMVAEEAGPAVPELVRRVCLHAPSSDPVPAMAAVLERMVAGGVMVGDVLADAGYANRIASNWAQRVRRIGGRLIQDLHPSDRGPKGSFGGAIVANGNLWCPAIPPALMTIGPLPRGATAEEVAAHDARFAEASRYKLGRTSALDADGYHRVECPASAGKLRCGLKPASMTLDFDHPEILALPEHPPRCCVQASMTVPPEVHAKTAQKHDYLGPAFRRSYARRSGAERSFSTLKDPATTDVRRGWCRLFGRAKNLVMFTMATIVRNLRVLTAFEARAAAAAQRVDTGVAPRTRRRRRAVPPDAG